MTALEIAIAANTKPDFTMPPAPVCCRAMQPVALLDSWEWKTYWVCPACGEIRDMDIPWPFMEEVALPGDWGALGFRAGRA